MQNRSSALQTDRPRSHEEHSGTRDRVDPGHVPPGLTTAQANARLAEVGRNVLPQAAPRSVAAVFLRQFLSPLIYILLAAAAVSLALGDLKDALFIGAVLLINGVIGTAQEHTADKAAVALRKMEQPRATVIRDGIQQEIDASTLVPGDLVVLEAGNRVPADLELTSAIDLQCDESLLTGSATAAPGAERPTPTHALSNEERDRILAVANEPRFADMPPARIVPMLADKGVYLASESSFGRVLRAHGQTRHRGRAKAPRQSRPPTTHVATGPRQLWCWDMTYLPAKVAGRWSYLYLILDAYSRNIVGFEFHDRDDADHAAHLVKRTALA